MTNAAHIGDFRLCEGRAARSKNTIGARARRLLRRIVHAVATYDQRWIERQTAVALARSGGRFTDAIEREIEQRAFGSPGGDFERGTFF